ncbi:MAG: hypothetical protein B6I22_07650 [Desulfobacteraceae bacterium 4572_123]|nr:MAG: hypothetical protein B6I22_07650 [Desulfobacteraceae bacterium 4572_123]
MAVRHIEIKPFSWVHPQLAIISRCDLDIYMGKKNALVIASQLEDAEDAGINVTDGAVLIASTVMSKYGFFPDRLVWIEHYPPGIRGADKPQATHERLWFAGDDGKLCIDRRNKIGITSVRALAADPDTSEFSDRA